MPKARVYERDSGSDLWSARIRVNGKLLRKASDAVPKAERMQ